MLIIISLGLGIFAGILIRLTIIAIRNRSREKEINKYELARALVHSFTDSHAIGTDRPEGISNYYFEQEFDI